MNIISLILTVIAVVLFAGNFRAAPWGNLGLGLALWATAWALQIIWATDFITI